MPRISSPAALLHGRNVDGRGSLGALTHGELDGLALLERPEAAGALSRVSVKKVAGGV
jgi:hypothetical protein